MPVSRRSRLRPWARAERSTASSEHTAEARPAIRRIDPHRLQLPGAIAVVHHGAAPYGRPVAARDQEGDGGSEQSVEVERVVALSGIEGGHVGVASLEQRHDLGLVRTLLADGQWHAKNPVRRPRRC